MLMKMTRVGFSNPSFSQTMKVEIFEVYFTCLLITKSNGKNENLSKVIINPGWRSLNPDSVGWDAL